MAKGSLQASKILSPHGGQGTVFLSAPTQCPRQDESLGFLSLEFLRPTSIHLKSPGAASTLVVGEIPSAHWEESKQEALNNTQLVTILAAILVAPPTLQVLTLLWTRKGLRMG